MEVFGCDVTTELFLSLYDVVRDKYSHIWKLEVLISSTFNFYHNENI